MQKVIINRHANIINGVLREQDGNVVAYDCGNDFVTIKLDANTYVQVPSEYIEQEIFDIHKECKCGYQYTIKETEDDGQNLCHFCGEYF